MCLKTPRLLSQKTLSTVKLGLRHSHRRGAHAVFPLGVGYVYLVFEIEKYVRALLQACSHDPLSPDGPSEYYFKMSSRRMRCKEVSLRHVPPSCAGPGFLWTEWPRLQASSIPAVVRLQQWAPNQAQLPLACTVKVGALRGHRGICAHVYPCWSNCILAPVGFCFGLSFPFEKDLLPSAGSLPQMAAVARAGQDRSQELHRGLPHAGT